jgi:hypothetical protein
MERRPQAVVGEGRRHPRRDDGENPAKGNTFLIWTGGTVKDFELRLSFRVSDTNNSGIQYRSTHVKDGAKNDWVVKGYQAEVRVDKETPASSTTRAARAGACAGRREGVWGDAEEGDRLGQRPRRRPRRAQADGWNDYRIVAKGNHVQHFINGVQTIDFTDKHPEARR